MFSFAPKGVPQQWQEEERERERDRDAGTCSVTLTLASPPTHRWADWLRDKQTDGETDRQRVGHTDRHTQLQPHSIVAIAREIDFLNANALHMS